MKHKKLTASERGLLGRWKEEGLSNYDCAKRLGRHVSTIGREINRNKVRVKVGKEWKIIYEPLHAQNVAEVRKLNAFSAKQPLKNSQIYSYVLEHLRNGWSPEQISGRLSRQDHKGEKDWQICHETIYQFIYKEKTDKTRKGQLEEMDGRRKKKDLALTVTDSTQPLWEFLRRKQKKRRKKGGRKVQRIRIPDRVSIHDRPIVIAKRKQFGHWEGDSIVGLGRSSGLHTEYERLSSLTRLEKMEQITAGEAVVAAQKIFGVLPAHAKLSTTLDNGLEHTRHKEFGINTYFADPYSAFQRGGNENSNLWTRYYFPKKTNFATISVEEVKDVEWELNNRPRKRLDFKTPQEVFNMYLNP